MFTLVLQRLTFKRKFILPIYRIFLGHFSSILAYLMRYLISDSWTGTKILIMLNFLFWVVIKHCAIIKKHQVDVTLTIWNYQVEWNCSKSLWTHNVTVECIFGCIRCLSSIKHSLTWLCREWTGQPVCVLNSLRYLLVIRKWLAFAWMISLSIMSFTIFNIMYLVKDSLWQASQSVSLKVQRKTVSSV